LPDYVVANINHLTFVADEPLVGNLEEMKLLVVCFVVANCSISTNHLHVTNLTFAGVSKRTVGIPTIVVPLMFPCFAGKK